MDTLNAIAEFFLRPGIGWMLLAALIGQVVKTQVFTRARAYAKGRLQWFWWWARKTMPLHPVLAGALIGLWWPGEIEAGYVGGQISGVLYFAIFGGLSVWGFETLRGLAKRQGVELAGLPGQSDPPPSERDTPLER